MKIALKKHGSRYRVYHNGKLHSTAKTLAEAKQTARKLMVDDAQ